MALIEKLLRRAVETGLLSKVLANLSKISKLCTVLGVLWLLVYLPMDGNFRNTYLSENALLANQAYSYFRETEWNNVRGFRTEIQKLEHFSIEDKNQQVFQWLQDYGLKPAIYKHEKYGTTLYAVLNAQRGDGTEAMVMAAPWFNDEGLYNAGALSVSIGLLRFFSTWPVWSKNIILAIPENPGTPLRSWVEAYHTSLTLTAGTIESALVLDFPGVSDYFEYVDIEYAGLNGFLPNLDFFNTAVHIAEHEGLKVSINGMENYQENSLKTRTENILLGIQKMASAGLDNLKGHESFSGWRIQALTLKAKGSEGPFDVTTFGRIAEAAFRSVNNLLEKFHQSFFFYLLLSPKLFVSIASYLPAAILLSVAFALTSLDSIVKSEFLSSAGKSTEFVVSLVFAGLSCLVSFLIANLTQVGFLHPQLFLVIQVCLVSSTKWLISPNVKLYHYLRAVAFLYLSIVLTSLLVVNFSLAFVIGLLAFPMSLTDVNSSRAKNTVLLIISNPFIACFVVTSLIKDQLRWEIFDRMIFAWRDLGCWTWYVVCIGWYTPWLLVTLACNYHTVFSNTSSIKKNN